MSDIRILIDGLGFPEGPIAVRDGSVFVTEINGGWISRITADGTYTRLGASGGGPNGIARGPDSALYVCNNGGSYYPPGHFLGAGPSADYDGGYVERVDPATGERRKLYTECDGNRLSAPNDIVFDRQGDNRMESSREWSGIYAGTAGDHADHDHRHSEGPGPGGHPGQDHGREG